MLTKRQAGRPAPADEGAELPPGWHTLCRPFVGCCAQLLARRIEQTARAVHSFVFPVAVIDRVPVVVLPLSSPHRMSEVRPGRIWRSDMTDGVRLEGHCAAEYRLPGQPGVARCLPDVAAAVKLPEGSCLLPPGGGGRDEAAVAAGPRVAGVQKSTARDAATDRTPFVPQRKAFHEERDAD